MRSKQENEKNQQPTAAGCLLSVLCVAVIFVVAVPVVMWRDPTSGHPLPRMVAIAVPVLAGGLCYGIGSLLLRLLGIPIMVAPKEDDSGRSEPADGPPADM
jgi:hypothetical protein